MKDANSSWPVLNLERPSLLRRCFVQNVNVLDAKFLALVAAACSFSVSIPTV